MPMYMKRSGVSSASVSSPILYSPLKRYQFHRDRESLHLFHLLIIRFLGDAPVASSSSLPERKQSTHRLYAAPPEP